ncbi:DC-STAMP domain-containing protein 2 [Trichonephila clavata]|uniref:DC-STAMP domain-containing protein 2 n=1 Tax=Trichonephila clavata TaxID=2740835 RepID=A0A8X6JTM4_TRICU|nr:DC-STAMP domain-containing protein 2 [Trichonephila clavata]
MRRFLRRVIRRKVYGDDTFEKISFLDRLVGKSILLTRILQALGRSKVYCVSCGEPGKPDDSENFKKCENTGCKGIYCNACFDDLGNKCTLCLKPVEYGDQSDESEEKDSSEDEEYKNMESSDDDDYVYQFGRRRQSSSSEDEEEEDRGSSPQKKRDLATIDDFSDEEQGSYV